MRAALILSTVAVLGCASQPGGSRGPVPAGADDTAGTAVADTTQVYEERSLTKKPVLANQAAVARALQQHFPRALRNAGTNGATDVAVIIDRRGVVREASVRKSSGSGEVDAAALRVVRAMRFSPGEVRGVPVVARLDLPVSFQRTSGPSRMGGGSPAAPR